MMAAGAPADGNKTAAKVGTYMHGTALAIGEAGILIRGPSGAGKSRLALDLIGEASRRGLFARLVGDDRVAIAARAARLIARGHPTIAGQIESRGDGILTLSHEGAVVLRVLVDLGGEATAPERLPPVAKACLCGVELPRLSLPRASQQAVIVLDHLLRIGNG
jgi:HPr kinase/phosphorylase